MAATTLQDFLVSVKYTVDTASQNTFLGALKRVSTSVGGITAEIGLLATGIFALSEMMAKAGESIYWMSQRLGSSVKGIQEAAFALSNVGVSANEAYQGMETFGEWMRRTGPAANAQLRMMGVTATDTQKAFIQLGQELQKRGGTYEYMHGTDQQRMQYAMTLSWAQSIPGMTEKIMLAAAEAAKFQEAIEGINKSLGLGEKELQDYARANVEVVRAFNLLNAQWSALMTTFGRIFQPAVANALKTISETIQRNMPTIKKIVEGVAFAFAFLVTVFAQFMVIIGGVLHGFEVLSDLLGRIVPGLDIVKAALLAFGAVLMRSPIGMFMPALTTLILLMDDYATWERGGKSHWDWTWLNNIEKWLEDLTGVKGILWDIVWALGAVAVAVKAIQWGGALAGAAGIASRAAAGAGAGAVAGGVPGGAPGVGGKPGAPIPAGSKWGMLFQGAAFGWLAWDAWETAKQKGDEGTLLKDYDPHGPTLSPVGQRITDWIKSWGSHPAAAATVNNPGVTGGNAPSGPLPTGGGPNIDASQLPMIPGANNPDYGARANNPGNLNIASWEPAIGGATYRDPQTGGMHTMARFRTMAEGVAAAATLLMKNQERYGKTIAGAFRGYAEKPFLKDLARKMGLDVNAEFDIAKMAKENPELVAKLMEGQMGHEGRAISSGALSHRTMLEGIGLATRPGGFAIPGTAGALASGRGVTINQQTTVNVAPGPNAADTAHRVGQEQRRINEGMVRNAGSNTR